MRYRTMERYRRAAMLLRAKGLQATPQALAKTLRISEKHVHDMLNRWPELRDYAGIVRTRESKQRRYEAVVTSLEARGLVVTAAAVAKELEMTISGVYKQASRYSQKAKAPSSRVAALKRRNIDEQQLA
jgi:uncharacterized ferritin-like protein (DUF455 family)